MAKLDANQIEDLLSHLKGWWDIAKDELELISEAGEQIKAEVKPEWDKAKNELVILKMK